MLWAYIAVTVVLCFIGLARQAIINTKEFIDADSKGKKYYMDAEMKERSVKNNRRLTHGYDVMTGHYVEDYYDFPRRKVDVTMEEVAERLKRLKDGETAVPMDVCIFKGKHPPVYYDVATGKKLLLRAISFHFMKGYYSYVQFENFQLQEGIPYEVLTATFFIDYNTAEFVRMSDGFKKRKDYSNALKQEIEEYVIKKVKSYAEDAYMSKLLLKSDIDDRKRNFYTYEVEELEERLKQED